MLVLYGYIEICLYWPFVKLKSLKFKDFTTLYSFEYRVGIDQVSQSFLLLALDARQLLKQPVVLFLFFIFH